MHRLLRLSTTLAVVLSATLWAAPGHAQQAGTISGRVVDASNLQPIASAQVFIPTLNTGALSREDGRYILVNVPAGTHAVQAQILGFRTASAQVTVAAGQTATADFSMQQDALALDEIIVTGTPGGTQRRAIGNVVTRVDAEALAERAPVANMQSMLTSRAPGLSFMRMNGNVGTGSQIRIRGVSSLELSGQPLIYVDGVRMDNSTNKGPDLSGQGAASSALDDINPDDIASIEVIKGPAAATLYGTEASAGVIQIITKKGQSGAPQFSLNVTQGANFLIDPAGKIGDQYYLDENRQLQRFNLHEIEKQRGNDVFQNGHVQGYNLSVRGGTDAIRYFLSGDWGDQVGILDYNTDERLSMRANVGVLITEGLNLDVSTGYVSGDTRYLQGTSATGAVWDNLQWAQGQLLDGRTRGYLTYTPEDFATIEATRSYRRFTGSATVTHTPLEWLTQRLIVGTDFSSDENQVLIPRHPDGENGPFRSLNLGDIEVTRPLNNQYSFDYSASAKYGVGTVGLTSSFGAQYFTKEQNAIESHGSIFASPAIRSIGAATNKLITGHEFVQNKSLGYYVQQEASFNDRIYLTAAVRMDDNSAFGSDYDAAIYPKVSASWVVSEEPFFQPLSDYVGNFRLRAAWGKAGRQPDVLAAVTLYDAAVGPGSGAAVTPSKVGNPDIGPEVSTELEAGFEASLLNERVVADFTYFYQQVRDALGEIPLAGSWGFPGTKDGNIAQLDNWGWEARLDLSLLERQNFAFNLGLTGAHSRNKIVDLGPRAPTLSIREGFPYPVYVSDIVLSARFDEQGNVVDMMCDSGAGYMGLEPGGAAVPCSETEDYELLMGTQYPQYTWTISPSLTLFGDLEVFGLIDGEFGRWGADYGTYCRHTICGLTNTKDGLLRDDPAYVAGVVRQQHPIDRTRYIYYDGDFFKLRELGARYRIPQRLIERVGLETASLSVSGSNLSTLWQRQKQISGANIADVQMASIGGGGGLFQWPGLSSITAALRVTF